jgi:hypothetical protein
MTLMAPLIHLIHHHLTATQAKVTLHDAPTVPIKGQEAINQGTRRKPLPHAITTERKTLTRFIAS